MRAPILTLKRARKLRRKMTLPEVLLWERIRGRRLNGIHFRRQHPVGPYILDFFCSDAHLAIEVDGVVHEHPELIRHDDRRDKWLAENGIRVLRFAASEVLDDEVIEGVLHSIARAAAPSTAFRLRSLSFGGHVGGPPPPLRSAPRGRSRKR